MLYLPVPPLEDTVTTRSFEWKVEGVGGVETTQGRSSVLLWTYMAAADNFWFGRDFSASDTTPINFIETRLHDLSPFSAHEVEIDGVMYKTAEHAYHALRMIPEVRPKIMNARSPLDAWRIAQQCKSNGRLLPGVDKDALMERIFQAKLEQHPDVRRVLLATNDRELVKVFDADYFWGTGADDTGQNRMGKLWMKLRADLQE